jgi:hypothetical protein
MEEEKEKEAWNGEGEKDCERATELSRMLASRSLFVWNYC